MKQTCLLIAAVLGAALGAQPVLAGPDPAALAVQTAQAFAAPRFAAVAAAAEAQRQAWAAFCPHPTAQGVEDLRRAFGLVADAWIQVDFMRTGPATAHLRAERFSYWLDRGNLAGKALNGLLAAPDEAGLSASAMAGSSAAGQGMPILERLLYGEGASASLMAAGPDAARRCAIGVAVSRNLADISHDIAAEWSGSDGAAAAIAANGRWGVYFADAKEAASVLLTDLVIGMEGLKDNELSLLFHDEANPDAPRLAEQWRSARSLADIRLKYAALRQALQPYAASAAGAQRAQLDAAFADVSRKLDGVAQAQEQAPAHSAQRAQALKEAVASMAVLQDVLMSNLPAVSGVPLGFNSIDGD